MRTYWKAVLTNGRTVNAPSDKPRDDLERLRVHGVQAALRRFARNKVIIDLMSETNVTDIKQVIRQIINPRGEIVTRESYDVK